MKYAEEGVQYHLNIKSGDVGKHVTLPGDPKRCEKIAKYFDDAKLIADHREYVTHTGTLNGGKVSVTSTGIGDPSAAVAMGELVKAGTDTFIRVGTHGGIQEDVKSSDIVITNSAIRAEETTKEYAPIEFPAVANLDVTSSLIKAPKNLGHNCHVGIAQCEDSFYGQHEPGKMPVSYDLLNKWEVRKRLGTLTSGMESAALFVAASYLHVGCGSCFLVVANQGREKKHLDNPVCRDTDVAIKAAIEAIKNLVEEDKRK